MRRSSLVNLGAADSPLHAIQHLLYTATVPVAIARFAQQYEVQHAQMAAASVIATIPAIVLMFFGQRFIVRGLTMGSVK